MDEKYSFFFEEGVFHLEEKKNHLVEATPYLSSYTLWYRSMRVFLLLTVVALALAVEPIRFPGNRSSVIPQKHRVSKGWPTKYLENDVVIVQLPDRYIRQADQLAESHGFKNKGPLSKPFPNFFTWVREKPRIGVRSVGGSSVDTYHDRLDRSDMVEWWGEMCPQERFKRSVWRPPTDPEFSDQWHLRGQHLRVVDAWRNHEVSGRGINLAVVDDGIQREHPDLSHRYVRDMSYDFNDDDNDPEPYRSDGHGTSAAGTAAASEDSNCGVGVAYEANLIGLRLLGSWTTDAEEARALCHLCDEDESIHIYSNSWGPSDEGARLGGPGRMVQEAFAYCTENGRGGKGSIYVWAGGNGRFNDDNSNYDAYANSMYTIAVGAINVRGKYTWYSEPGANLLCSAPSSGIRGSSIVTTDLMSTWGYSINGCTEDFGGTSAAAPQISGLVALMLEANPELTWRDVQHILVNTSRKTDSTSSEWTKNDAGFTHSHDYGFGMADADAAVSLALTWDHVGPLIHVESRDVACNVRNTDYVSNNVKQYVWRATGHSDRISHLEHVRVNVDIDAPNGRGCVKLILTGPTGVSSILQDRGAGQETDIRWTYDTVRHWGESTVTSSSDKWILRVEDMCSSMDNESRNSHVNDCRSAGQLRVNNWSIDFYGYY